MRHLKYEIQPPLGAGGVTFEGSCGDLIKAIPYLLAFDTVPPLPVLNTVLKSGRKDAGMSGRCAWTPFELTAAEYDELSNQLSGEGYHLVEPPEWVESESDWTTYLDEVYNGVPSAMMRVYRRQIDTLDEARLAAYSAGDEDQAVTLTVQLSAISQEMHDWRQAHARTNFWRRRTE